MVLPLVAMLSFSMNGNVEVKGEIVSSEMEIPKKKTNINEN